MGSGQVAGMQGAVGIGGIQQPQPPHRPDYAAVAVKTEPGGGPASTGKRGGTPPSYSVEGIVRVDSCTLQE
jgi:hypothetical protein